MPPNTMKRYPARKPQNPANLWPGMTLETGIQFSRIGRGLPVSKPNQFAQVHVRYYHVVDYGAAGDTQFTFFNAAQSDHVTNVNNGQIPDERPFWLTGICITPQDLTAAGARSGTQLSAAAITAFARAEEIRTILQGGLFQLFLGDRKIVEAQDLTHFPSDGGPFVSSAAISFAAATNASAAPINNGEPVAGNRFRLPAPYPILPGKTIKALVSFKSLLTITTAMRLKVELVGESILPLNA